MATIVREQDHLGVVDYCTELIVALGCTVLYFKTIPAGSCYCGFQKDPKASSAELGSLEHIIHCMRPRLRDWVTVFKLALHS
jgi:hypothetical protein